MKINPSIRQRPVEAKARTLKPNQNRRVFLPLNTGCPKMLVMEIAIDKSSSARLFPLSEEHHVIMVADVFES